MASSLPPPTGPHTAMHVLVLMRALATPLVLYADNPMQLYDELRAVIRAANPQSPKLIEKQGVGPLKKVAFLDTEVAGVAIQVDPGLSAPAGGSRL